MEEQNCNFKLNYRIVDSIEIEVIIDIKRDLGKIIVNANVEVKIGEVYYTLEELSYEAITNYVYFNSGELILGKISQVVVRRDDIEDRVHMVVIVD